MQQPLPPEQASPSGPSNTRMELGESGELLGVEVLNATQWLRQAVGPQRLMELAMAV